MRQLIRLSMLFLLILGIPAARSSAQIPTVPLPVSGGVQTARPLPNPSGLGFYEYLPAGYGDGTLFPLVVFFHGQGERGNGMGDLSRVLREGPPKLIAAGTDFPAIVISPQLPLSRNNWATVLTTPFVTYLLETYAVDPTRVYVTGLSLGGGGAWTYAKANPDRVAAIVPICGTESNAGYQVLADLPVWAFHNIRDPRVPFNNSNAKLRGMTGLSPNASRPTDQYRPGYTGSFINGQWVWTRGYETQPLAGTAHFTVFERDDHDAWTDAYANQAMWDWLFAQARTNPLHRMGE